MLVRSQIVDTRHCLIALTVEAIAAECFTLDVLVNQAGYESSEPKIVRAKRSTDFAGNGTFQIRRVSDNSTV